MALDDIGTGQDPLSSLIGYDTQHIYDTKPDGVTVDTNIVTTYIGGATSAIEDPRYAGKAIQCKLTTSSVAPDALVITGWYNRTGLTVPSGKYIFAVAA